MDEGDPGGGSSVLVELIDKHGEAIAADLEEYSAYHLKDLFVEGSGLTPRLCLVILRQLPLGARTVAALRGSSDFQGWDQDRYMTATLIDAVRENTFVTLAVASGKKKPKKPEPYPRPERKLAAKKSPNSFASQIAARAKRIREQREKVVSDGSG